MSELAATGFVVGDAAVPELAAEAVRQALRRAGTDFAHGVLLLLSGHFARHAQPAVTAAGRAARCLQVAGCTVPGLFTEQAWALDQPAAAALVLTGAISLGQVLPDAPRLSFCQSDLAQPGWISEGPARLGTLAGAEDESAGSVWGHGKVLAQGRFEGCFAAARLRTAVSRGMRLISAPLTLGNHDRHEIYRLDGRPALQTLTQGLSLTGPLALNMLFAAVLDAGCAADEAVAQGRYSLLPIVAVNPEERSVTLAAVVPSDALICWALRDAATAQLEVEAALTRMSTETPRTPAFGLMFSCIGRGPYFYGGEDLDIAAVTRCFPDLPLLGAYGPGEIGPLGGGNTLFSYSSVISLVTPDVQSH